MEIINCCQLLVLFYLYLSHQVLLESDQLRKTDDFAGPLCELQYWQKMSLRFNSIVSHVKGPECKAVVMVLHISRSKLMKVLILKCSTSTK